MNIKSVVFDLDGTLVNSLRICTAILNAMLADRGGASITELQARPYISVGGKEMVRQLLGRYSCDPKDDIAEFRQRYVSLPTPQDSLFEGVTETLFWLRQQDYVLGICSNKPQRLCEKILTELDIAHHFSAIIGGDVLPHTKPAAGHLLTTIERMGSNPEHTLYIGDSETDYQLALNAHVLFIYVTYGYGNPIAIPASVTRIDTILYLPSLVGMP
ncbi:MAG TPA: HAD-IA family hydrolase [Acidobacteriaceae bacterium]|jgi:phosphoglycolate phosphatase|nr:HAD-IA family hydrolase [Acidobacteriaceae bacterium]